MHARLMNACSLSLTDQIDQQGLLVRPSVHGPRRLPSWRSNANASANAVPVRASLSLGQTARPSLP
jgi:hypothetical protein